jgi:hypothetical protein
MAAQEVDSALAELPPHGVLELPEQGTGDVI